MVVDVCSGRGLGITVAVAHGIFSGSLNILLKFLISTYDFNYLTLIQCLTSGTAVIVLETLRRLGKVDIPPFSLQLAKTFGGVTILSTLQSTLTLWSLRGLSLPMYVVFKRCLPLVTLSIGVCVLKNGVPSLGVAAAVFITTTGAALAGAGDLTGDPFGYVTGVLAVIIHASYLVLIQKTSTDSDHGPLTAQYAIAIMASPVLLACSFVSMDAINMWTYQGWKDPHISCIFTLCVAIGCAMNFTTLHCTYINSAVTTSFVGVVKSVATITVGMLAFEDVVPTRLFIAGVVVNTVGSVTYCVVKYFETKRKLSYQDLEEDGQKDGPLAGLPYGGNEKPPLDGAGVQVEGGVAVADGMVGVVGSQSQSPVADCGDDALLIGKGETGEPEAAFLANNGDTWPSEDGGGGGGGGGGRRSLGVMSERDVVEMQREHLQSGTTGGGVSATQAQSLGGVFRSVTSVRHLQFMKKDALLDNMEEEQQPSP